MSKKHALIIGINKYLYMDEKYQLGGCVNDAKLMKNILINKFNFDPSNIVALYDEDATRDAILAEMERLANVIAEDDVLVFHYSGHGHQCKIKTEFSDEGSGKDNCLLPCDDSEPSAEGDIWREIRDKQINEWLQRIAKKTQYTTLIFDACHSATMTRSSEGSTRARSVPSEARPLERSAGRTRSTLDGNTRNIINKRQGAGGWLTLSDNYVVISGCRDTQKSKEKYFVQDERSVKHGVLTYNLSRALLRAKPGTTYRDAFELTCSGVIAEVSEQNPQIEGAIDCELFGVKDIEPLAHIAISDVNGTQVTLDGGAAHGLRFGSKWNIYPPGAKLENSHQSFGVLQVNHVGALSSTAVLIESRGQILVGARCIEIETAYAADLLQIDVSALAEEFRASIGSGIRQSKLLSLAATPDAAHIRASIIDSPSALLTNVSAQQKLPITQATWAFFEDEDVLAMPLHPVNEPGAVKVLLSNLEKIARFRNVLLLDNPRPTLKVEFNLFKQNPDGNLVLANGGNSEFSKTDPLVLELKNNEAEKTVFFSILWISATREIAHFYPHRKTSEELSPGKKIRIGLGRNKLTAALSDDYPANVGSEFCKVMFSTTEADFSWLNQEGVRTPSSSVAAFDTALMGIAPSSRAADGQDQSSNQAIDDWDAVTRSFILTRTVS
jgi:hypothetical protein